MDGEHRTFGSRRWHGPRDSFRLACMSDTTEVAPELATDVAAELWQVRLASGEIRPMTFDELEEAFHAGVIDDATYVLEDGTTTWRTLRQIADDAPVRQAETETVTDSAPSETASESPVPISAEAIDTDYDLKLVDFRPRQRAMLAIVAGAALAVVAIVVVSLNQPPLELPLPTIAAPPYAASTATEGEASVLPIDIQRHAATPVRPQPNGSPASRSKGDRSRLFQRP